MSFKILCDHSMTSLCSRPAQAQQAMDKIFPGKAHHYTVPASIRKTDEGIPHWPLVFPFDIWINRCLTQWIMPCNHTTWTLLISAILIFTIMVCVALTLIGNPASLAGVVIFLIALLFLLHFLQFVGPELE